MTWLMDALCATDGSIKEVAGVLSDMPNEIQPANLRDCTPAERKDAYIRMLSETYLAVMKMQDHVQRERQNGKTAEEAYNEVKHMVDELGRPQIDESHKFQGLEDLQTAPSELPPHRVLTHREDDARFGSGRMSMMKQEEDTVMELEDLAGPSRPALMEEPSPAAATAKARPLQPPAPPLELSSAAAAAKARPAQPPAPQARPSPAPEVLDSIDEQLVIFGDMNDWDLEQSIQDHKLSRRQTRFSKAGQQESVLQIEVPPIGLTFRIISAKRPGSFVLYPEDETEPEVNLVEGERVDVSVALGEKAVERVQGQAFMIAGLGAPVLVEIHVLLVLGGKARLWFSEVLA